MVTWSDIQKWDSEPLFVAMDDFRQRREKAKELADRLYIAGYNFQAEGKSADAIRNFITDQTRYGEGLMQQYSELMLACSEAGDNVSRVKVAIEECFEYANQEDLHIAEDGSITAPYERTSTHDGGRGNLESLIAYYTPRKVAVAEMMKNALRLAEETDKKFADQLRSVAHGEVGNEEHGAFSQGLPDLPDPSWNETTVAVWWDSLTPEEQQHLIQQHPDIIGNTNGIDATSRDQANRIYVEQLLTQTNAEIAELDANLNDGDDSNNGDAKTQHDRLIAQREDLLTAQAAVAGNSDRQLLVVDTSGDQTRIAVASGNVDTAKYITNYVPGVGSNARDSLENSMRNSENIIHAADRKQGISTEQIAAVTWIGYDAPPTVPHGASPENALEGAPLLGGFLEGIHASRGQSNAGDPYMTVVGHSYGSTTSGMALDKINHGVVDDFVLLGSPGAGVQNPDEYNIDGNAYISGMDYYNDITQIGIPDDIVQGSGPDETHGVDPMFTPGFTHISNGGHEDEAAINPADLHDNYLLLDKNGNTTPILTDISDVVAGGQKDPGE